MSFYWFIPSTTSEPPPEPPEIIPGWLFGGRITSSGLQYVHAPLGVNSISPIRLKATDTAPARMVQLVDAKGLPFPIPTGATVAYRLRKNTSSSPEVEGAATIESRAAGIVKFSFPDPLPAAGNYHEEWTLTDGTQIITFPGSGYVYVVIENTLA